MFSSSPQLWRQIWLVYCVIYFKGVFEHFRYFQWRLSRPTNMHCTLNKSAYSHLWINIEDSLLILWILRKIFIASNHFKILFESTLPSDKYFAVKLCTHVMKKSILTLHYVDETCPVRKLFVYININWHSDIKKILNVEY